MDTAALFGRAVNASRAEALELLNLSVSFQLMKPLALASQGQAFSLWHNSYLLELAIFGFVQCLCEPLT
jgi:hypothetical protein